MTCAKNNIITDTPIAQLVTLNTLVTPLNTVLILVTIITPTSTRLSCLAKVAIDSMEIVSVGDVEEGEEWGRRWASAYASVEARRSE